MSESVDYKVISKVQIPDGSLYDIKPSENANINTNGIYYVSVTGSDGELVGTIDMLDSYYDGLKIVLYNNTGASITGACTLNINNLGAISIKRYDTTNINTIYNKTIAVLCYVNGVFYHNNYYDANTNTVEYIYYIKNIATDSARILKYTLCGLTSNNRISSFTSNTSTSTGTKDIADLNFRIGIPIFYRANDTIAANTVTTSTYDIYENKRDVNLRYSMCAYNANRISATGPTYFYMNVIVDPETGTYKAERQLTSVGTTDHIVCMSDAINELLPEHFYIYLGMRNSSSYIYYMNLVQDNKLFYYDGTNFIDYYVWLNNLNKYTGFETVAPIAGQDIDASEEYPAIVYMAYYAPVNEGNDIGSNLIYDITSPSYGYTSMCLDWGFAVLTENIKAGDRIDPKCLHRKWTYILHPDKPDDASQGYTKYSGEYYRLMDKVISSFIAEHIPIDSSGLINDGPNIYMCFEYKYGNEELTIEPRPLCITIPYPPYDPHIQMPINRYDVVDKTYSMIFSSNIWDGNIVQFADNRMPIFYNMGKVNFEKDYMSISLDFTKSEFQAYDNKGVQHSLPGYSFSSGNLIGTYGPFDLQSTDIKLYYDIECDYSEDTSILMTNIPGPGLWKVDVQATFDVRNPSDNIIDIDCFLSTGLDSSTLEEFNIVSATRVSTNYRQPFTNVYLTALVPGYSEHDSVMFSVYPYLYPDSSLNVKGNSSTFNSDSHLSSGEAATRMILYKVASDAPAIN